MNPRPEPGQTTAIPHARHAHDAALGHPTCEPCSCAWRLDFGALTDQDALRERIRSGEQLPSVRELAEEYVVSRAMTARGVRTLADEGLVTIVPNWGTFIPESKAPRQP